MNKELIQEIVRQKELISFSHGNKKESINEQFKVASTILKSFFRNGFDDFAKKYGDDAVAILRKITAAADESSIIKYLNDLARVDANAAKEIRGILRKSASMKNAVANVDEIATMVVSDLNSGQIDDASRAIDDYLEAIFPKASVEGRMVLKDMIYDSSKTLENTKPKPKPKSEPQSKPTPKPPTMTDKIMQGLGLQDKALEDIIRSKIKLYKNKTNDEIAKILKDYEDDLIRNDDIKKQLNDIILKKGLREKWSELSPLRKIGFIISIPIAGPAILTIGSGLAVLYYKKYNLEFLGALWRWITTLGGIVVTPEEAKDAAPDCVRDSIYKNEDGEIVIYLSDEEELLLTYDWDKDKWMYEDGEDKYKLEEYCD